MGPARPAGLRGECPPASALRRLPPPLFRPEGLRATPDCGSQAWEKARLPCFAPLKRSASWNAGANALGCEIKEEASASGRRRGTFAPQEIGKASGRERGCQYG